MSRIQLESIETCGMDGVINNLAHTSINENEKMDDVIGNVEITSQQQRTYPNISTRHPISNDVLSYILLPMLNDYDAIQFLLSSSSLYLNCYLNYKIKSIKGAQICP
jgi:hypothetical protein